MSTVHESKSALKMSTLGLVRKNKTKTMRGVDCAMWFRSVVPMWCGKWSKVSGTVIVTYHAHRKM